MKDLKKGSLEYEIVGELFADLKKEFNRGDDKMMEVAELKKVKQENKTIEEFVQEFRRAARESRKYH